MTARVLVLATFRMELSSTKIGFQVRISELGGVEASVLEMRSLRRRQVQLWGRQLNIKVVFRSEVWNEDISWY